MTSTIYLSDTEVDKIIADLDHFNRLCANGSNSNAADIAKTQAIADNLAISGELTGFELKVYRAAEEMKAHTGYASPGAVAEMIGATFEACRDAMISIATKVTEVQRLLERRAAHAN
ncbi:MAG TPA: hypothetical protein GXX40_05550 [Firmicutes bacterium]|nr:hypothetical protein [Bacillota bacterium]